MVACIAGLKNENVRLALISWISLSLLFLFTPFSNICAYRSPIHGFFHLIAGRRNYFSSNGVHKMVNDRISQQISSNDVSFVKVLPKVFHTELEYQTSDESVSGFGRDNFAAIFRQSAPYISMHRGSIMVLHIPGYVLRNKRLFESVIDDVSLLHLLGVKLVIVLGVRDQLDERIKASGATPAFHTGMRITDENMLQCLKEESGAARYEIESALARGIRGMNPAKSGINVVSGNLFYSAKPLGVRDGIDFKLTGEVRKIEVDNFVRRLDSGDIVLLTSLGYSNSGEVFNVPSESLAAECAAQLKATKVIYLTEGDGLMDARVDKPVQSLRLSQAREILEEWGIAQSLYNYVESHEHHGKKQVVVPPYPNDSNSDGMTQHLQYKYLHQINTEESVSSYMRLIARCVYALTGGVRRAHLVPAYSGSLLQELYTTDGSGMLICRDMYEGIRPAMESDLRALQGILKPLEEEGILVPRSRDDLMKDIPNCFVMVRDNVTIACGMLKQYSESHAEIACLAVHPSYRRGGRGETMLTYLEHRAVLQNISHIFVLSTRTMQWFEERGFSSADPSQLPPTRTYNPARNSKVYIKRLGNQRELDAENLLWDIA